MVAVELEGSQHTSFGKFKQDCEKYNRALQLGWLVLRFTNSNFMKSDTHLSRERSQEAIDLVKDVLMMRARKRPVIRKISS